MKQLVTNSQATEGKKDYINKNKHNKGGQYLSFL